MVSLLDFPALLVVTATMAGYTEPITMLKHLTMLKYLLILLLASPLPLLAAQPPEPNDLEPLPEAPPPPLPESVPPPPTGLDDEDMEPEVKIIKRDDAVVHEYRIKGRLYMVKVIPRVGPPYYLYDGDGNGSLESRSHQLDPAPIVPNWRIHSW